jgi:hypothetical protein
MQFSKRAARGLSLGLIVLYGNAISLPVQAAVRQEVFGRFKIGTEGSTPTSTLDQAVTCIEALISSVYS